MNDIKRSSNSSYASTISPSYDQEILNILQANVPESDVIQLLTSMPETYEKAFSERLKQDSRYPTEMLRSASFTVEVERAKAVVQFSFNEVEELGRSIAEGKGPLSETEKKSWEEGQAKLRRSVIELAYKVSMLSPNSPDREEARAEITKLNKQLIAVALPALARINPELGKA